MEEDTKLDETQKSDEKPQFKKPVLIGRIGKLPKKAKNDGEALKKEQKHEEITENAMNSNVGGSSLPPAVLLKELSTPIPYKEPKWSGMCPEGVDYGLEVLKSGIIMEKIDLTNKPYYVFGRLANSDVVMAHPTISRHHCVLQYKEYTADHEPAPGWYLYDLGSTHGTFLNKDRMKANHYTRVRVGHQIKFGNSTRTYIMVGPDFDCDGESDLTVSEIKQKALDMKLNRERMIRETKEQREKELLEEEKKREEQGIDWGMGEDAEAETDLSENPYASTANEELYLADPKKTLRGFFEREGLELTYNCEERGVGQFLCKVELPLDDASGRPVFAEVLHRGKKKEAVLAAALLACRTLDRAGLLRRPTHESRSRKQRDWSENDYYDSDEDPFLDRTGNLENKRNKRKHANTSSGTEALTYDDLLKQVSDIESKIQLEEKSLERLRTSSKPVQPADGDADALDVYMNSLGKQTMSEKAEISKTKMRIQKLKAELSKTSRLADIARPAHLPPLLKKEDRLPTIKHDNKVLYGKRIKLKDDIKKPKPKEMKTKQESEFIEEMDSDDETNTTDDITNKQTRKPTDESTESEKKLGKEVKSKEESREEIKNEEKIKEEIKSEIKTEENKRVFGPMRPPDNYVVPDNYFEQETDRDVGLIEDD